MTEEEKKQLEEQQETTTTQEGQEEQAVVTEQPAYTAPQREPAQLRNWYETLFRQDNAGEEAEISDEQRRKMARRERAERVIAGLGDIGTHIANIAFAGKGATPAKPTTTMSANIDNSWQRYNQDIEQRRKAYRQGLNAARQMDYRQYIDDRKQQLAEEKEERMREKYFWQAQAVQDRKELNAARIAAMEAKTENEKMIANARVKQLEAAAKLSQARADGKIPIKRTSGGGSGTKKEEKEGEWTFLGKKYRTKQLMNEAVYNWARKYGVPTTRRVGGQEQKVDVEQLRWAIEDGIYGHLGEGEGKKDYSQYEVK